MVTHLEEKCAFGVEYTPYSMRLNHRRQISPLLMYTHTIWSRTSKFYVSSLGGEISCSLEPCHLVTVCDLPSALMHVLMFLFICNCALYWNMKVVRIHSQLNFMKALVDTCTVLFFIGMWVWLMWVVIKISWFNMWLVLEQGVQLQVILLQVWSSNTNVLPCVGREPFIACQLAGKYCPVISSLSVCCLY